jgi:hypothetical protein
MKAANHLKASALALVVLAAAGGGARADLIVIGGFETGDFTGWTKNEVSFPQYIVTSPVHSGNYAAQIAGFDYGPDTLTQAVTDTAGQSYTLSFWRLQTPDNPIGLTVTWNGNVVFSETDTGPQPYQNFTASVVGTGNDLLVFTSYNNPGFTYLDDVSLSTPAPIPGTGMGALTLIAFAGLAAYRKSRAAA